MTTTRIPKDIDHDYSTLCAELGDLEYKYDRRKADLKARMQKLSIEHAEALANLAKEPPASPIPS